MGDAVQVNAAAAQADVGLLHMGHFTGHGNVAALPQGDDELAGSLFGPVQPRTGLDQSPLQRNIQKVHRMGLPGAYQLGMGIKVQALKLAALLGHGGLAAKKGEGKS